MAGVVHIPWYATGFRGDKLAEAVTQGAAASIRYGATQYSVQRSRDDRYKILQMVWFETKLDWERYWEGPEMVTLRANCAGWFQIPVLYVWHDEVARDVIAVHEPVRASAPASVA
jgi:hypothetical protein